MKKNRKKSRFNLYDWLYKRDHKDTPDDDRDAPRTFLFYFKLLWRNMGRLLSVNLYFVFGNLTLFLLLLMLGGVVGPTSTAPASDLFAPLYGASLIADSAAEGSSLINLLLSVHGSITEISVSTPLMVVIEVIAAVILAVTFGPVMAGLSMNLRSIVKGEPLFMWQDFWHAIKTNLWQSMLLGVIDLGIIALLIYGIIFYYMNLAGGMLFQVFFLFSLVLLVMYNFMRKYLYLMLVTFELSIPKLFKNALIFSLLGLGRNLLSTVGCLLIVFLNLTIFATFMPLGMILPFIITIGVCLFTDAYAAWPKIQSTMIDPYLDENGNYINEEQEEDGEEDEKEDEQALVPQDT